MAKSKANADETTLKLIEEVKRRRAEISKAERSTWLTNSSFAYVEGSSNTVNIKVITDLKVLIAIAAFLKGQEANYKAAAVELGVESPPSFTWGGFSLSDWMEDLMLRKWGPDVYDQWVSNELKFDDPKVKEVAEMIAEHVPGEWWDAIKSNLYAAGASNIANALTNITGEAVMDRRYGT